MDLGALANQLVGGPGGNAAQSWLADLAPLAQGAAVTRHIQGEANLPTTPEGRQTVRRFAERLLLKDQREDPIAWYEGVLRDPAPDLVLHGPEADPALPGTLCRVVDAWTVRNFLARDDRPGDPDNLEGWLQSVCSPDYFEFLDPSKLVSAAIPSLFSTFQVDREAMFPAGTPVSICLQIVGKEPPPTLTAHALLKYQRGSVAPPRLPTAFDASTHPHFLPPPAGAPCGTTKNLTPGGYGGVREVVVRPFLASQLDQPEYIAP